MPAPWLSTGSELAIVLSQHHAATGCLRVQQHQPTVFSMNKTCKNSITCQSGSKESCAPAPAPYPWIMNPAIDMLFVCGGMFWLLIAFLTFCPTSPNLYGSSSAFWLALLGILGIQIFVDPHQPATLFRVYASRSTKSQLGKRVTLFGVIAIFLALIMLFYPPVIGVFLQVIFAWGVQHWLAQAYGIALIYCYKRQYKLSRVEREIMHGMVRAAIIFLWFRMFYKELDGPLFTLGAKIIRWSFIPEWLYKLSLEVFFASMALFIIMVVRKLIIEKRLFPLPALGTLLTLMVLPFIAHDTRILGYVFASPFFHSSQYMVVSAAFYFKEQGLPADMKTSEIARLLCSKTFAKYFAVVFLGGVLLSMCLPYTMTYFGVAKAVAFPAVYVMLNFHHFVTDAFIWKLRDKNVQTLLVA